MSQENVELSLLAIEAFNRRDLDAFLALMDDGVRADSRLVAIEGGYQGHDGIRRWWDDLFDIVPDFAVEVVDTRDLGNVTLIAVDIHGRAAGSDVPIDESQWQVIEWRETSVTWWAAHKTEAEALEAARLRE